MGQPVKISDELILDARLTAEVVKSLDCCLDRVLGATRPSDRIMPLMRFAEFDWRPIPPAIADPDGAVKATFFHAHPASAGLRFVNADVLAAELAVEPYEAARQIVGMVDAEDIGPGWSRAELRPTSIAGLRPILRQRRRRDC